MHLTWLDVSQSALIHNLNVFRQQVDSDSILAPAVKGNAYGHGLLECATALSKHGADYLCLNAVYEAELLRRGGLNVPLLIIGYTPLSDLKQAIKLNCDLTVYHLETLKKINSLNIPCNVHLKIETGIHRQGIYLKDLKGVLEVVESSKCINVAGISTHFANIEDRIHHDYALKQLDLFHQAIKITESKGVNIPYKHCANSAASLVLPESHFNFIRPGVGIYGMWPSEKTKRATMRLNKTINLKPAITWKARVAQIKEVPKGGLVGYGCTYTMPKTGRIAVLTIGYYDGYPRSLSNKAEVLIQGKRAPVVGRICMNMIMVNVSHIHDLSPEDEAVLLGKQGDEVISPEELATLSGTINYEVTTRIPEHVPRIFT